MDKFDRRAFIGATASAATASLLVQNHAHAQTTDSSNLPGFEFAMAVTAEIDPVIQMGKTPQGERRVITISGGKFEGPRIKGIVMPGGEDWQLTRADGVTELEARYWLKTDDGAIIRVLNRCMIAPRTDGPPYIRTAPQFEAPIGTHDWLNKAMFVGTLTAEGPQPKAVILRFYKVT